MTLAFRAAMTQGHESVLFLVGGRGRNGTGVSTPQARSARCRYLLIQSHSSSAGCMYFWIHFHSESDGISPASSIALIRSYSGDFSTTWRVLIDSLAPIV